MENGPQSFRPGALTHLKRQTIHLEQYLLQGRTKESTKERLLDSILYDVGGDTVDRKARLLAVGYGLDLSGYVSPEPLTVDSEEARFRGVEIMPLNNEERVLLHYSVYDPTNAEVADQYFVPPLAVLESVIDEERNHPLFEVIEKTKCLAERMFREQDFFRRSTDDQATLLHKYVCEEFVADVAIDYTEEVLLRVGCDWYYQLPLSNGIPDDWSPYIRQGAVLEGYMTHAVYPDYLQSLPKQITEKAAFADGQGLPYIALNNPSIEGLILIPLAATRSFASDIDHYV